MILKDQLRIEIEKKRRTLTSNGLKTTSSAVIERFQSLEVFQTSKIIGLYKAIGGEVSVEPLFSECWKLGKRTCIPLFNEETRLYEMAEIEESTPFRIGHYGIQEPIAASLLEIKKIDLMAVPGVAFDFYGNRLGRGGGYYDRILAELCGISIGVAFDFQVFSDIPRENHDKPVDFVITETKFLKA